MDYFNNILRSKVFNPPVVSNIHNLCGGIEEIVDPTSGYIQYKTSQVHSVYDIPPEEKKEAAQEEKEVVTRRLSVKIIFFHGSTTDCIQSSLMMYRLCEFFSGEVASFYSDVYDSVSTELLAPEYPGYGRFTHLNGMKLRPEWVADREAVDLYVRMAVDHCYSNDGEGNDTIYVAWGQSLGCAYATKAAKFIKEKIEVDSLDDVVQRISGVSLVLQCPFPSIRTLITKENNPLYRLGVFLISDSVMNMFPIEEDLKNLRDIKGNIFIEEGENDVVTKGPYYKIFQVLCRSYKVLPGLGHELLDNNVVLADTISQAIQEILPIKPWNMKHRRRS